MEHKNHPGVYIPPPLIYVAFFLLAIFLQKKIPVGANSHPVPVKILGALILLTAAVFLFSSLRIFFRSKNTLITIRPANSLQTGGVYRVTRNPMYCALALVFLGLACLIGNWWHLILFPLLVVTVQEYIIKREENYLGHHFGAAYFEYKSRVRRWL